MTLEDNIFAKTKPVEKKLINYGFVETNGNYQLHTSICHGDFRVLIEVTKQGKVTGKVTDAAFGDEYNLFRMEEAKGEYVATVLEAYTSLLQEIRNHCFVQQPFSSAQANRLTQWIFETFHESVEFPWTTPSDKNFGIFREKASQKWYSIIMELDGSKFGKDGVLDLMNVKLEPDQIVSLLAKPGYRICYHMNKQQWISIDLDDALSDEEIEERLQTSRDLILKKHTHNR